MDYSVKPIGRVCSATGDPLEPGATSYSALVLENGKLARLDFSAAAWNGPPEHALAWWQGTVPAPRRSDVNPLDPDSLLEYFERLSEAPNDFQEKLRYVLALLLVRKRRLRIEGSRTEDGTDYLQVIAARGEGSWEVRDPELAPEEIDQIQAQLLPAA